VVLNTPKEVKQMRATSPSVRIENRISGQSVTNLHRSGLIPVTPMYPDPLSFSRVPVEPAKPTQAANPAAGEMAFATLYAEQMQAVKEIGQLSSDDPSTAADSSTTPMDNLLDMLQLQTGRSACAAGDPLNVASEANSQMGNISLLQSRNAAKLYSEAATENSKAAQSDLSSQPEEATHTPSGLHRLISWLDSHAHLHSTHHCAASVRQAMEAAGIHTAGRPVDAGDYGPFLLRHGARAVDSESYQPQPGDIAVFDKSGDHPSGHVQVFNGQHWVSDFVQQSFSPYRDQESTPPATVYRLS
jgi:hypothetical protein